MPDMVLVIGGSGRTGRLVVRRLLEQERPVRVMSRRTAADDPRVDVVHGGITDASSRRVIAPAPVRRSTTACASSPRPRATRAPQSC
jgi:uncharacterized protein YbjT (DUF2867 family)